MITVLKEIENIINNRPFCFTYFKSDLIEPITPNKLLYGRNVEVINIVNDTSRIVDLKVRKREKYLQTLLKHFWSRWTSEYLTELREHQGRSNKNKTLVFTKVNDLVLMKHDNYKRSDWKIGRVAELIYSKDDQIRAAKVNIVCNKTIKSLNRPVNRLFLFEVAGKKKEEVTTFIDEERGPGTICRGSVT